MARLLVTEAEAQPGGVICSTARPDGFLWEGSANSFQPSPAMLTAAVRRLLGPAPAACHILTAPVMQVLRNVRILASMPHKWLAHN